MQVTITSNAAEINRRLSNMVARQLPYAIAKGLNDTAKTLVEANKRDMQMRFRNPVPFTLNAYYFKYAKRGETSVTIQRKTEVGRKHYLEVQEAGGPRKQKGFEKNFESNLASRPGVKFVLPTSAAPVLKSGHMSQGFLRKVEAQLKTARDPAMRQTEQSKKRQRKSRGKQYFVPELTHPLSRGSRDGVYERTAAGNVVKVLNFPATAPKYTKRTRFHQNMPKWAARILPGKMNSALAHAIRTARL